MAEAEIPNAAAAEEAVVYLYGMLPNAPLRCCRVIVRGVVPNAARCCPVSERAVL
jgi:hypothetical protein